MPARSDRRRRRGCPSVVMALAVAAAAPGGMGPSSALAAVRDSMRLGLDRSDWQLVEDKGESLLEVRLPSPPLALSLVSIHFSPWRSSRLANRNTVRPLSGPPTA
jgi:hypothetical protein